MSKKSQSAYVQKSMPAEMWASQYLGGHLSWSTNRTNCLTQCTNHCLLVTDFPVLLEHVPLHQQHMRFMHDGSPPYFLLIVRQHLNQTFDEQWVGRGGQACTILWPWSSGVLVVWTRKDFRVFSADQWLRGITATSRECLPGDSRETTNFRQGAYLCETKSWKLCWNAWEPHRACAVEITRTSPMSQQVLVSGYMLTGAVLLI
jgi:hypothetical protein